VHDVVDVVLEGEVAGVAERASGQVLVRGHHRDGEVDQEAPRDVCQLLLLVVRPYVHDHRRLLAGGGILRRPHQFYYYRSWVGWGSEERLGDQIL